MTFEKIFKESKIILTGGALVQRLKTEFDADIDKHINHAGLIYSNPELLELLYRQYIDIGHKNNLPIMVMTPTRKVNFDSLKASDLRFKNVIVDACKFLNRIKASYNTYSQNIMIGGSLGCKGDAYSGEKVLNIEASYSFHKKQTNIFQNEKVDFLFAGIMPEINEAIGMAMAMAETRLPYIISFMTTKDGCLMDGTPITEAITKIDNNVIKEPICYMANCIHPTNLKQALIHTKNKGRLNLKRFKGIQANASTLSPEELDNGNVIKQDDFDTIIREMYSLYKEHDLKIFGGCCGTNDRFLDTLSDNMMQSL